MKFKVVTSVKFDKSFRKIDRQQQIVISKWIKKNLIGCENPYISGKSLSGNLKGYWRYRVGDYRLIADIKEDEILIFKVDVGHRKEIYE